MKIFYYVILSFFIPYIQCSESIQHIHYPVLFKAVKDGDYGKVEDIILDDKKITHIIDEKQNTLLHTALQRNSIEHNKIANFLLSMKVDFNAINSDGNTPLHEASIIGNDVMIEKLLQLGSNVSVQNRNRETPLNLAIINQNKDSVVVLMKHYEKNRIHIFEKERRLYDRSKELSMKEADNYLSLYDKANQSIKGFYLISSVFIVWGSLGSFGLLNDSILRDYLLNCGSKFFILGFMGHFFQNLQDNVNHSFSMGFVMISSMLDVLIRHSNYPDIEYALGIFYAGTLSCFLPYFHSFFSVDVREFETLKNRRQKAIRAMDIMKEVTGEHHRRSKSI